MSEEITRREFVKQTIAATATMAGSSAGILKAVAAEPTDTNKQIVLALGSVFIPSKAGDPGYKELESHGISDYVMQKLPVESLDAFNNAAKQFFAGKSFLDLDEKQREEYLALVVDGSKIADAEQKTRLQTFYRDARTRILSVFYKNYPEHAAKRALT